MTTTIAAAAASTTTTTTRCNEYFPQRSRIKRELDAEQLSVLPDELRRDHGFLPLPKKFNILVTLFNEMEKVVQHSYSREQRKTFAEIAKNVEKNSKRKFTEKHLAQIVAVYPTAYALRWERSRDRRAVQLGLWDLMVQPNLERNQDLASFASTFHCTSAAVTTFKTNTESKLLEKTATMKSPNKEEEEAVDSSGEKSTKNGWAIPADESQQPQLQQQSPGKRMTPLPLSPVKLISPMKKSRANAADFIYRSSPTKPVGGSSRAQRTIAFCTPVLDRRIRMDANRLKWRKLIFRHLLVERVREAHRKFLAEHKLEFHDPQSVHAQFRPAMDELVADIGTEGAIPRRPQQQQQQANSSGRPNLQATDIRTFLQSVNRMDRQKTPERQPSSAISKSEPQTPQQPVGLGLGAVKFEPKTPLEERLKAKFAANQAARAAGLPEMQKRRALLYRLDNSILELLRAHLNLEQRFSVAVTDRVLLQKLGKEINAASLLEHLRLLCQLLPPSAGVCWLESLAPHRGKNDGGGGPDSHFFKVSKEMGPEWAQRARAAVKEELATLEQKMARTPLHRSPSSCF